MPDDLSDMSPGAEMFWRLHQEELKRKIEVETKRIENIDKEINNLDILYGGTSVYRTSAEIVGEIPPYKRKRGFQKNHHCNIPGWWGCVWNRAEPGDEWVCDCGKEYKFMQWEKTYRMFKTPHWRGPDGDVRT